MKKMLFAQAQYLRKREFTILTKLIEENGKKYITKEAVYPEGKNHVESIYSNYRLLQKSENNFKLPKTTLVDNVVTTDYIDSPNLAAEIETLLIERKIEEANKKVSEFIKYLNTIPVVKTNPYTSQEFTQLFDPDKKHFSKNQVDCWYPGFHDINFDNFIKKDKEYYFIDFEWCFDFPLPKNFLILRAIFFLSLKLKSVLKTMTAPDFPCVNYYDDVLTPLSWLKLIDHSEQKLQQMLDYEYSLFSKKIKHYDPLEPVKKGYMKNIVDTSSAENQQNSVQLEAQIADLVNQINHLQTNLESEHNLRLKKETQVTHLLNTVDELTNTTRKYQTKSYELLEKLESTKIAQFKLLRIFVRKLVSLFIRVINIFN